MYLSDIKLKTFNCVQKITWFFECPVGFHNVSVTQKKKTYISMSFVNHMTKIHV
jgi:hypothetical protein